MEELSADLDFNSRGLIGDAVIELTRTGPADESF
jgi:hypothetical protein